VSSTNTSQSLQPEWIRGVCQLVSAGHVYLRHLLIAAWLFSSAASCDRAYDPIAELPYRRFASVAQAMQSIVSMAATDSMPLPSTFAVGEYHPTSKQHARVPPITWFYRDMLPALCGQACHLLLETWTDDLQWTRSYRSVSRQIAVAIDRPKSALAAMSAMPALPAMQLHMLSLPYVQQQALLDAKGHVDFFRLLVTITEKLGDAAIELSQRAPKHNVIIYGGAIHNDLYPAWGLGIFSYAGNVAQHTDSQVVEIDVVVPEIVGDNHELRRQDWFLLLKAANPHSAILYQRGLRSFVLITPTNGGIHEHTVSMKSANPSGSL
jgi:hypothetical protein